MLRIRKGFNAEPGSNIIGQCGSDSGSDSDSGSGFDDERIMLKIFTAVEKSKFILIKNSNYL